MGTPPFAACILDVLLKQDAFDVSMVYTMPDRPAGRGARPRMPAVKTLALERGLLLRQPENFREPSETDFLVSLEPDFLIVAAYGLILPESVLAVPRIAPVNVHASLLPAFRGAAPIQRAIMGATSPGAFTGVSIMRMTRGMDSGPVYASEPVLIGRHNSGSLTRELAGVGAKLLVESLPLIAGGALSAVPQDEGSASYAPKINKSEATLDFKRSCAEMDAMVRALTPAPGARCVFEACHAGADKIFQVTIISGQPADAPCMAPPGTLYRAGSKLFVACSDGFYKIERLKPAGRKEMSAGDFLHGYRFSDGLFGSVVYQKDPVLNQE